MLMLSKSLLDKPVLSLRTGAQVATTTAPIFNPNNLKIEGFYCLDRFDKKRHLVLLYQDIRDFIPQGFVVNDHDVLADPHELVRLKELIDINFELLGKPVQTLSKDRIGKISDYATEVQTMYVQKLYVAQSVLKSFTGGSLSVDRTQIVEITPRRIIIQDLTKDSRLRAGATALA